MPAWRHLLVPGADPAAVSAAWAAAWGRAVATWPRLALDEDRLARFVATRLVPGPEAADPVVTLAEAPMADLALADACLAGDERALAAFEAMLSVVDEVRVGGAGRQHTVEVKQRLRVQLLMAEPGRPAGLASYAGRGPLRGWVRIVATRELLRLARPSAQAPIELEDLAAEDEAGDPALAELKATYRDQFAHALRDAISDLGAEDRLLLRQHLADRLGLDHLAALHGAPRSTVARWVERARAALLVTTQQRLSERLDVDPAEIASVIRLVHSRLDASVVRYLREG